MKRIVVIAGAIVLITEALLFVFPFHVGNGFSSAFVDQSTGVPSPARVIFIGVDTLRADHLSSYGYFRNTSPELDRFAAEDAIFFERAHASASWTLPSMTSVFTSTYPPRHRVETKDVRL